MLKKSVSTGLNVNLTLRITGSLDLKKNGQRLLEESHRGNRQHEQTVCLWGHRSVMRHPSTIIVEVN